MIKIVNFMHGAVLNKNHGIETENGLEVKVEINAPGLGNVRLNGRNCARTGASFSAAALLKDKVNTLRAEADNILGRSAHEIRVLWDKSSFKRFGCFIDDNIFFLHDIVKNGYRSLFDCFYLRNLKKLHAAYGAKIVLNIFYRNDHSPFDISLFPETHKNEWRDNASWLKLSFHAYSEFPDRPYQYAGAEKLAADYDLVREQIIRFAGEESFCPPMVIHWAMAQPEAIDALVKHGVRALAGQFIGARTAVGQKSGGDVLDIGYFVERERSEYLRHSGCIYDFDRQVMFVKGDVCFNLDSAEQVLKKLETKQKEQGFCDFVCFATHEQYSFPFYERYIPDHFGRMEAGIRWAVEHGFLPVFAHEGLLGNMSWE